MQNQNGVTLTEAHEQWRDRPADERFESMATLKAAVQGRRMRSRAVDVTTEGMGAKLDDGRLVINGKTSPVEPSHWSFGQLSTMLKAPAGYLRTLPAPLLVDNLNNGFKNAGREAVKFMTITAADEDPSPVNRLQAVTSTTYGRIWDADVVDCILRIQEKTGGRFHNPLAYQKGSFGGEARPSGLYASDHDMFAFLIDGGSLLESGPRATFHRGFCVWNSETGSRTFGLLTFLFNKACGNHFIYGATDISRLIIRHSSGGPYRFDSEAAPQLLAYANQSAGAELDVIRRAQAALLPETFNRNAPKLEDLTPWVLKHGKFSRAEISSAVDFAKAEEGECKTVFHLMQGFTAYARGYDYIDARVDLETRAGKFMQSATNS